MESISRGRQVGPFEDRLGGFGGGLGRRLWLAACLVVGL